MNMTHLVPMGADTFAEYKAAEVASFAEDNVSCGRWPAEGALARSLAEFEDLLPQGAATPNNRLLEILESERGATVGYLWFAAQEREGQKIAFIYDIQVKPAFRRRGHAKKALTELEQMVKALGLARISLHVSGRNPEAQALYGQLGFAVMGISMSKALKK
jgi:ribosomal protein S18 acetylase RimI-like enzyme